MGGVMIFLNGIKILRSFLLTLSCIMYTFSLVLPCKATLVTEKYKEVPQSAMETFLDEINFQVIKERPLNGTMDCFALNKDQYYAIGYYYSVNLNKHVVAVYNKDNTFLYSLTFGGSGAFDIKWENDNLMILLYREDKIIAITTDGQLKSLYDTSEYKAQLPQTDFDGRINKIGKAKVFEQNGYSYRVSSTMVERTDPDGTSIIIYKAPAILGWIPIIFIILFVVFWFGFMFYKIKNLGKV